MNHTVLNYILGRCHRVVPVHRRVEFSETIFLEKSPGRPDTDLLLKLRSTHYKFSYIGVFAAAVIVYQVVRYVRKHLVAQPSEDA